MNLLYLVRHFVHRPKDFYHVFVISQNAALFQISRYLLSSKSRFGINHTQWHRLFQGKASTIINGIDCYQERHRPLKVASLVYERENCAPDVQFLILLHTILAEKVPEKDYIYTVSCNKVPLSQTYFRTLCRES